MRFVPGDRQMIQNMHRAIALALCAAAGPAFGQASVTISRPGPSLSANDQAQFASHSFDPGYRFRQSDPAVIGRAGAWGRCVVDAAAPDARAYLAGGRVTQPLRWQFNRCERKVGLSGLVNNTAVSRAALTDALRPRAG